MIKIDKLNPFGRLCITLGMLPSSYKESLTYEEQLLWMLNYIEKTLIPTINNNAQAVEELQALYLELKSYVDSYFENLNVQQEINNKLDQMAESGQLTDIIAQYLGLAGVLAFNTLNDLKNAENITEGSICKTLGYETYNDGKGEFYKIRTITSSDVVDNINIVALQKSNTLIAEKINNYDINEINNKIDLINGNDTIFLGDSYAAGTTYESGNVQYLTSWCEYLRLLMGLTTGHYYIYAQGNAGFAKIGNNNMNFQMTLNSHLNDITNKEKIKNIIVCAGYNDWNEETTLIKQRIGEFISFCKTNFPNAQVYIGMIGGDSRDSSEGRQVREQLITRVLNAYNQCNYFGGIYLSGVENFTHNFYQFNEQGNHPNEAGYNYVANMIYNAWKNGYATIYESLTAVSLTTNFTPNLNMQSTILNGTKTIFVDNFMVNGINLTQVNDRIQIVPANTSNKVAKCTINSKLQIPGDVYIYTGSKNIHAPGKLIFYEDGSISLESTIFAFEHEVVNLVFWPVTTTHSTLMS